MMTPPVAAPNPVNSSVPARWKASKAFGGRMTALFSMARSEKCPVRSGGTVARTAAPILENPLTTWGQQRKSIRILRGQVTTLSCCRLQLCNSDHTILANAP